MDKQIKSNLLNEKQQRLLDIKIGQHVIDIERDALDILSKSLNASFADAIEILHHVRGRIIVSGMGKSGHIGVKIAATMASTGSPAQFVHPAEASHGDLGMITADDAILALSNSGETQELRDLVLYAKRFSIPLIAITSKSSSTLANNADVSLILPDQPEASSMGLAPTTSTTMALALGDALAVTLLEGKDFSATDFKVFHPGGKLGQQLMPVGDLMHKGNDLPLVNDSHVMRDAILTMTNKPFGCVGVVCKDGNLKGIITDGDLRRHMANDLMDKKVKDIMTIAPITITPNLLAAEVIPLMNEAKISAIFIVEDKKPVGIIHLHDFLRAGVV